MNNARIMIDNIEEDPSDRHSVLEKQQGELSQIVEAIKIIEASSEWQKLKRLVLDDIVNNLERQLLSQVSNKELNQPEIYRLQGQLMWAKKYTDLSKLGEVYKQQIEGIKLQLKNI